MLEKRITPEFHRAAWLFALALPLACQVLLGERLLAEGVGYTVDREAGQLTILDPAFGESGARYFISVGNLALGNMSLTPRMKALLKE